MERSSPHIEGVLDLELIVVTGGPFSVCDLAKILGNKVIVLV